MPRPSDQLLFDLQREEASLYENVRDWRFAGVMREFAALHALLDSQFSQIGERLALLAGRSGNLGSTASRGGREHVLAARRPDGTYDVRESEIVAGLADLHLALSSNLEDTASVFCTNFGDDETAGFLRQLAGHHKKDASMLRALLWEDKPQ